MNDRAPGPAVHRADDKQHSRLLRFFAVECVVSALAILALVGFSMHAIFTDLILREAEADAVRFGRAILERERDTLIDAGTDGATRIVIDPDEFPHFDRRAQADLGLFHVSKIKLYSKDKTIVYSTDHAIIGERDPMNEELDKALEGGVVSEFHNRRELWDLSTERRYDRDMVETYLPIGDGENTIVGAFEIYMDVASYRNAIGSGITTSMGALCVILVFVFATLSYFMRRATRTIYSRTEELHILRGLLPICSFCKKIQNDEGDWESTEAYITARSESVFSHSLCPECKESHYPDV